MLSLQTSECSEESTDQGNINHSSCKLRLPHVQTSIVHVCVPSCSREVSLVRQRLVAPHQVTFTGQATPVPAAVPVARYGANCLLVWKIALGQWKWLHPRGDMPFLWQLTGNA